MQATDRIANLYPLADFPTGAFLSVIRSGMIAGIPVVHGLTGSAQSEFKVRRSLAEALERVCAFRPTVLWGVPSFRAALSGGGTAQGRDLSEVRLVITSGEPMPPALRNGDEGCAGACGAGSVAIRGRYAFTEMQGGLVQCADDAQAQNVTPDLYYLEVVDPDAGRRLPGRRERHARRHPSASPRHGAARATSSATSSRCRASRARSAAGSASGWWRRRGAPAAW